MGYRGQKNEIRRGHFSWVPNYVSLSKITIFLGNTKSKGFSPYLVKVHDPLIRQTLHDILGEKEQPQEKQTPNTTNITKNIIKVQYRGKSTEG